MTAQLGVVLGLRAPMCEMLPMIYVRATRQFWTAAAADARISDLFRQTCLENAEKIRVLVISPMISSDWLS